jgi:hypothetical protein
LSCVKNGIVGMEVPNIYLLAVDFSAVPPFFYCSSCAGLNFSFFLTRCTHRLCDCCYIKLYQRVATAKTFGCACPQPGCTGFVQLPLKKIFFREALNEVNVRCTLHVSCRYSGAFYKFKDVYEHLLTTLPVYDVNVMENVLVVSSYTNVIDKIIGCDLQALIRGFRACFQELLTFNVTQGLFVKRIVSSFCGLPALGSHIFFAFCEALFVHFSFLQEKFNWINKELWFSFEHNF